MDAVRYLKEMGGVARVRQLTKAGFSRSDLAFLESAGALRPKRGVLALPGCDADFLAAVKNNARVSCVSAAKHYGLWLRRAPDRLHLSCNHGHGEGFIRHRTERFPTSGPTPLAAVEDVILHALTCLPVPMSTALATSGMRLHGVPLALLESELTADRSGTARTVLRLVDPRCESLVEVEALQLFSGQGWHVELQVPLEGIGRVDFLIEGFLIVEVDGFAYHSSREAMRRDVGRNNASALNGYPVLRYMPEHVWNEPERIVAEIRAVLGGRIIR